MKKCINYGRIHRAIEYYDSIGYKYIDAEWTAPEHIMNLTMPEWIDGIEATLIGPLVGSGEQYFLNEIYNKYIRYL